MGYVHNVYNWWMKSIILLSNIIMYLFFFRSIQSTFFNCFNFPRRVKYFGKSYKNWFIRQNDKQLANIYKKKMREESKDKKLTKLTFEL